MSECDISTLLTIAVYSEANGENNSLRRTAEDGGRGLQGPLLRGAGRRRRTQNGGGWSEKKIDLF